MPDIFVPAREAVKSVLVLAQYVPEAARHAAETLTKIFDRQKITQQFQDLLKTLWNFHGGVEKQYKLTAPIYKGTPPPSPAEALMIPARPPAAKPGNIEEGSKTLTFEIISGPEGEMERHYRLPNNKLASVESYKYLDSLFREWMYEAGLKRENGKIYSVNQQNEKTLLTGEQLKERMNHSENGFSQYVDKASGNDFSFKDINIKKDEPKKEASQAPAQEDDSATMKTGRGGG